MLPLFTRRVALSAHLSTAAYLRIQPSSAPILRLRGVLDGGLPTCTAKSFANPRRNASTEVTATTNDADSPTISSKERKKLTHEWAAAQAEFLRAKKELGQKMKVLKRKETAGTNAALKAKSKARVQKEKEREKARAEKEKEREKARAEKEKEKEKARKEKARKVKKPIRAYIMTCETLCLAYPSRQTSPEGSGRIFALCQGRKESSWRVPCRMAESFRGEKAGARHYLLDPRNGTGLTRGFNAPGIRRSC